MTAIGISFLPLSLILRQIDVIAPAPAAPGGRPGRSPRLRGTTKQTYSELKHLIIKDRIPCYSGGKIVLHFDQERFTPATKNPCERYRFKRCALH